MGTNAPKILTKEIIEKFKNVPVPPPPPIRFINEDVEIGWDNLIKRICEYINRV